MADATRYTLAAKPCFGLAMRPIARVQPSCHCPALLASALIIRLEQVHILLSTWLTITTPTTTRLTFMATLPRLPLQESLATQAVRITKMVLAVKRIDPRMPTTTSKLSLPYQPSSARPEAERASYQCVTNSPGEMTDLAKRTITATISSNSGRTDP